MYKKITLIILSEDQNNLLQIFDKFNKKIEETFVSNKYIFNGKINESYKIKTINSSTLYSTGIFISEEYNNSYILDTRNRNLFHTIFIKLKDQNYDDLRIEKGMVKLWQNHIT